MFDIRLGQFNQHHAVSQYEQAWILVAAFFGLGFIFSVLALVCALIALCR